MCLVFYGIVFLVEITQIACISLHGYVLNLQSTENCWKVRIFHRWSLVVQLNLFAFVALLTRPPENCPAIILFELVQSCERCSILHERHFTSSESAQHCMKSSNLWRQRRKFRVFFLKIFCVSHDNYRYFSFPPSLLFSAAILVEQLNISFFLLSSQQRLLSVLYVGVGPELLKTLNSPTFHTKGSRAKRVKRESSHMK